MTLVNGDLNWKRPRRKDNTPDVHSDDVLEIFERAPDWLARWGIMALTIAILLAMVGCIVIRYPDILTSRITMTTEQPPITIVARNPGKIRFMTKDNQAVKQGDVLAYIQNSSSVTDVLILSKEIEDLQKKIDSGDFSASGIVLSQNLQVGDLAGNYLELLSILEDLTVHERLNVYHAQIASNEKQVQQYILLNQQLELQRRTQHAEFELVEKQFQRNEKLFKENVIAQEDFDRSKISLLQLQRALQSSENAMMSNNIAISQLRNANAELVLANMREKVQLLQKCKNAVNRLQSQLNAWKQQYMLIAPSDGSVSIFRFYVDDQFVDAGTPVMALVTSSDNIYGQVLVPIAGSGKLEVGQRVNIKLDNFPFQEYGMISGKVDDISLVPQDNMYNVRIVLPKGLVTSYKKELPFRQQLSGTAEIITRELSLFERLFYSARSLLHR